MQLLKSVPCSISHTQRVARKHLRTHMKRLRQKEYSKLRAMVPAIAHKEKVPKVKVIEEAIKYIDELHKALAERLQNRGLRNEPITEETVQEFVQQMMPLTFKLRPVPTYEKQQKLPTFLLNKLQKRNFKRIQHD